MSFLSDKLAEQVRDSVIDLGTYREDWEQALTEVFGKQETETGESTLTNPHCLTWTIDQEADSPQAAAAVIWSQVFGRQSQPGPDEACIFTVAGSDETSVEIDLSDPKFTHLFT